MGASVTSGVSTKMAYMNTKGFLLIFDIPPTYFSKMLFEYTRTKIILSNLTKIPPIFRPFKALDLSKWGHCYKPSRI